MTANHRKVLLIGWDAADLTTLQPVLSPMLWTFIATGKWPFKHGILAL